MKCETEMFSFETISQRNGLTSVHLLNSRNTWHAFGEELNHLCLWTFSKPARTLRGSWDPMMWQGWLSCLWWLIFQVQILLELFTFCYLELHQKREAWPEPCS